MIHPYALVGLFLLVALVFGAAPVLLAWLLSPKKLNPRKLEDCQRGNPNCSEIRIALAPQHYLYGVTFVVFGVAVAFLFPWALAYPQLSFYEVVHAIIFLAVLGTGLGYVWRKGWMAGM